MTIVHTVKHGKHVLAIQAVPGQPAKVVTIVYNTTLAKALDLLSKRPGLIVH